MNYHLNKVVGDNETGFDGTEVTKYRIEAWDFILAGGGLFNNLDYSFTPDNEDGSFIVKAGEPGSGGKTLRNQFRILADFMKSIDFVNMAPLNSNELKLQETEGTKVQALGKAGEEYAIYLHKQDTASNRSTLEIDMPPASYYITWVDTKNATTKVEELRNHAGGWVRITSPFYSEDIALKLIKISN
jgi:hypothetical protein